jgi:hypothetical protein
MTEGGGDAFSVRQTHRERKFSTTSLVYIALKMSIGIALVKHMSQWSIRPGAVVPLASARGITVTSRREHSRMRLLPKVAKPNESKSITTEPKAKPSPTEHQRTIPRGSNA